MRKIISVLILITTASFGATSVVKFAKGSHCGSFTGDFLGRKFLLDLNKNQLITVNLADWDNVKDIVIKSPKGQILDYDDDDGGEKLVKVKGIHTVTLIPNNPKDNTDTKIEFCVFDRIVLDN